MAKSKETDLNFVYRPRSNAQKDAEELWRRSRILFFIGPAGTGKTSCAMGLALREALSTTGKEAQNRKKLWLARPHIACGGENLGYMPGELSEKLSVWQSCFRDCFDALSGEKWGRLENTIEIEAISVGLLRGRSLRNGTLIVDESQLLSYDQLVCVVTRLGENSRIVICGDPTQSDKYDAKKSPMVDVARRLSDLDTVSVLRFAEQLRDPLVADILDRL